MSKKIICIPSFKNTLLLKIIKPSASHDLFANGGFEIFQESPKCDTEMQSEQMLLQKMALEDLLSAGLPQAFNL